MDKKAELEQFHRERILDASRSLFREHEPEQTTMDDIAKAADYSKATLYVYFKNKDEIYHTILLERMKEIHQQMIDVLSRENRAMHQYVGICLVLSKFYEESPSQFDHMMEIMVADTELREKSLIMGKLNQMGEDIIATVGVVIQNGIIEGVFREDIPELASSLIYWSSLSGIIEIANKKSIYIRRRTGMSKEEFLKFGFRVMLRSVLKEGVGSE